MTKSCPVVLLLLVLASVTAPALAANTGLFINAKWGDAGSDLRFADLNGVIDGDSDYRALEIGWRFTGLLAVQVGYHDFDKALGQGSPCPIEDVVCPAVLLPIEAATTAFSVSLATEVPLTKSLNLYGKLGVVAWETDITKAASEIGELIDSFSDEDLIYGVGIRLFLLGGLSVSYEFEWFGSDLEAQSLVASYSF